MAEGGGEHLGERLLNLAINPQILDITLFCYQYCNYQIRRNHDCQLNNLKEFGPQLA